MKKRTRRLIIIYLCIFLLPLIAHSECLSVKEAQKILQALNYYPEKPDGVMGPATRKVIKTFQMDFNLEMTGRLNEKTCQKLLKEKKTLSQKVSPPPKKHPDSAKVVSLLTRLGYYQESADTDAATRLREALIMFQHDHHLKPTGLADTDTLRKLYGDQAHPNKNASSQPMEKKTATPQKPVKKKVSVRKTPEFRFGKYELYYMTLDTQSTYDSGSFESKNETMLSENKATFIDETALVHSISGGTDVLRVRAAVGSGEDTRNILYSFDLSYDFMLKNIPLMARMHHSAITLDYIKDIGSSNETHNSVKTIDNMVSLLYRVSPTTSTGLSLSYSQYPTLISAKPRVDDMRVLLVDENFNLTTIGAAFNFTTIKPEYRYTAPPAQRFTPFFSINLTGGLGIGEVSSGAADAAAVVLNNAIEQTYYGLNLGADPEAGIIYRIHAKTFDMDLTLSYRGHFLWPLWQFSSSQMSDGPDTVFELYRKDITHGPALGCKILF